MHDRPQRIVRSLWPGERFPSYSTAALIFGCSFPEAKTRRPVAKPRGMYATALVNKIMGDNREAIKEMMLEGQSFRTIAKRIRVDHKTVSKRIKGDSELREIATRRKKNAS